MHSMGENNLLLILYAFLSFAKILRQYGIELRQYDTFQIR